MEELTKLVQDSTEPLIDELSEEEVIFNGMNSSFLQAKAKFLEKDFFNKGTWKQGDLFFNSPNQSWGTAIFEDWLIRGKMPKWLQIVDRKELTRFLRTEGGTLPPKILEKYYSTEIIWGKMGEGGTLCLQGCIMENSNNKTKP